MMKCEGHGTGNCKCKKFAPVFLRLGMGIPLALHGWDKLSTSYGDLNMEGFTGFVGSLGVPAPEIVAWIVALLEFAGGIALVAGAFTTIVASLVAVEFIFILLLTSANKDLFGGSEIDVFILAMALSLAATGAGTWSVDEMMRNKKGGSENENQNQSQNQMNV